MKIKFESPRARELRQQNWHKWYAWHPVRISSREIVWLDWVLRSREYSFHVWKYRLPSNKEGENLPEVWVNPKVREWMESYKDGK